MEATRALQRSVDWGSLAPLRLRARVIAEGVYAGAHRSARRGAGVEFGGFREYTPGDDLRWLDRRSMLLHERLVVRQFETETDRALHLVVDATASMAYRGPRARGAKLAYAATIAAVLARLALGGGDPVALAYLGGEDARPLPRQGGREQLERIFGSLEAATPGGDARLVHALLGNPLETLARTARRGAVLVVVSDLLDLPEEAAERIAQLASRGRIVIAVQTLDPDEARFPWSGPLRLRAMEGGELVETDGDEAKDAYLTALARSQATWDATLARRGARLVRAETSEDPVQVVRRIVERLR